jgi:ligand-binding sensor domain-containing protein
MSGIVRALTYDSKNLYVGSDRGIAIIALDGDRPIQIFEAPSALIDDDITDLAVTDGILWAATRSGLIRFVPATREQRVFTAGDGLVDQDVQRITVDGDYLWLGTPSGVSRFRWNNPQRID